MMTTSIQAQRGDISIRRLRKTFSLEGKPFDVFRDLNCRLTAARVLLSSGRAAAGKPRCCVFWRGWKRRTRAMW
jgi:NitT/TauT family transport system ATP-binding protein/sulfonate transport system ATP-binding protein